VADGSAAMMQISSTLSWPTVGEIHVSAPGSLLNDARAAAMM